MKREKQTSLQAVKSFPTNVDNFPYFPYLPYLTRPQNTLSTKGVLPDWAKYLIKNNELDFLLPSRLNILFTKRLLQSKMLLFIFYSIKIVLKFYSGGFHKRPLNQNPVDFESWVLFVESWLSIHWFDNYVKLNGLYIWINGFLFSESELCIDWFNDHAKFYGL